MDLAHKRLADRAHLSQTIVDVPAAVAPEQAVVLFQLGTAAIGGLAALIAGSQLAGVTGPVSIMQLIIPTLIAGGSNLIAAFLLPGA